MTTLLRLASDPGLLLCAALVVAFLAVAWRRAYVVHRENQRWFAERAVRRYGFTQRALDSLAADTPEENDRGGAA